MALRIALLQPPQPGCRLGLRGGRHRIACRWLHGFGCVRYRGFRRRYFRFWHRLYRNFALRRRLRRRRIGTGLGRLGVRLLRPRHGRLGLAGNGWRDLHLGSHSHAGAPLHGSRSCRRTVASAASRGVKTHPICRSFRGVATASLPRPAFPTSSSRGRPPFPASTGFRFRRCPSA